MFMRKVMTCLLGGLLVLWSVAAFADNVKDVNVVNTPDVKVTNDIFAPVPVMVQRVPTTVEIRFIGFTEYRDDGSFRFGGLRGIPAMHKACDADYGPGARAATLSEALFWGDVITLGVWERAWLVPSPNGIITIDYQGTTFYPVDVTTGRQVGSERLNAVHALSSAFCGLYESDYEPYRSPVLTRLGQLGTYTCAGELPVACAAPIEVPVTR